jgi:hypothetical protein
MRVCGVADEPVAIRHRSDIHHAAKKTGAAPALERRSFDRYGAQARFNGAGAGPIKKPTPRAAKIKE